MKAFEPLHAFSADLADRSPAADSLAEGRRSLSNEAAETFAFGAGEPRQLHWLPVSSSSVLLTLHQLAVMSQNGVEIAEAVGHVARNCQDARLADSLHSIHHALSGGTTLSVAVARHGRYFPPSLPAMLAAAEATGEVPQTLGSVCDRMRDEMEMRDSIVGAMVYPVILIGASSVVMVALVLGVLPQFGRVFESMGRPVPASTQLLLDLGTLGQAHWMYLLPVLLVVAIGLFSLRHHPVIRGPLANALLYAPLVRDAYRPLIAGRIFRTIAAMVRGGVPLLQAVRLTRNTVTDPSWFHLLERVESNLIDGVNASDALATADFLPSEAAQMMATGERTGRVPEVLEDIGKFYEQEGARRLKRLVVAFEPFIILVMGVIVAAVVMSVMLPLLDVSTVHPG